MNNIFYAKKKYIILILILAIGMILYTRQAIYTGLWFDEAVEYFFSRFMVGDVPGEVAAQICMKKFAVLVSLRYIIF